MENSFSLLAIRSSDALRRIGRRLITPALVLTATLGAADASAQERIYFPAIEDAKSVIIQKIQAETVRVDIATWFLVDGEIVTALINKFQSGVPVRVIGDRVSVFEQTDLNTRQ